MEKWLTREKLPLILLVSWLASFDDEWHSFAELSRNAADINAQVRWEMWMFFWNGSFGLAQYYEQIILSKHLFDLFIETCGAVAKICDCWTPPIQPEFQLK